MRRQKHPRVIGHEFVCPKCGGSRFGTSGCTGPVSKMIGHCHGGLGGVGCGFSWPRSEDWRHFTITLRPTREEYQRYEALRRREQTAIARAAVLRPAKAREIS